MSLKTTVKVGHLSNLSDARYCAGMGVELIGFGAIPATSHFVPASVFQEIRGWISGPKIIAELYGVTSEQQIADALNTFAPDYLELTWDEFVRFEEHIKLPCIVHVERREVFKSLKEHKDIAYVLVNDDTSCEQVLTLQYPVLIAVSALEKLREKEKQGCFHGYAIKAPPEARPGVTNYEQLGVILEALEEE